MIRFQCDAGNLPEDLSSIQTADVERVGAQLLRFSVDLAREERRCHSRQLALEKLEALKRYDLRLIKTLIERKSLDQRPARRIVRRIQMADLSPGMVVDEDVRRCDGILLLSAGQAITELAAARLKNSHAHGDIGRSVKVRFELEGEEMGGVHVEGDAARRA